MLLTFGGLVGAGYVLYLEEAEKEFSIKYQTVKDGYSWK